MKVKVSEATPIQIDWMVAKCEGVKAMRCGAGKSQYLAYVPKRSSYKVWRPSSNWVQAGPIIEREDTAIAPTTMLGQGAAFAWEATIYVEDSEAWSTYGPTPLIATMRCYVVSKLGEEVEIPDELMEGV